MSDYPPPPAPSYPPPPAYGPPGGYPQPPAGGGLRLPWEERSRLGFGPALVETVKLLATDPKNAFGRLRADGDLTSPLLFGLLVSWVGAIFYLIWNVLFQGAMGAMTGSLDIPIEAVGGGVVGLVATIVLWPIFYAICVFIGSGIYHLALMIVGALATSPTRFEGTLKVICYAGIAQLANVVPLVGGLIAGLLGLVLTVIGFTEVHRTTLGRSIGAVALILAICCVCVAVVVFAFGAAIMAAIGAAGAGG